MAVNISGTVLASLFYDQSSSKGDQVGFLLGEVLQHVTDTISDSQINNVAVETKIFVYDCLPCAHDQRFFNSKGEILHDKIVDVLRLNPKNIVGWYSFRRYTTLRPSFRERLLHRNLSAAFGNDSKQFLFMLCSGKQSSNRSTHTFDHCFLQQPDTNFKRVLVSVVNLGETTHTEYKYLPSHTVSTSCGMYSQTVNRQQGMFLNEAGQMEIQNIKSLNGALSQKLHDISGAVIDSEESVSQLDAEVQQLRARAQLQRLERKQREQRIKLANSQPQHASVDAQGLNKSQSTAKQPSVDDLLSLDYSEMPTGDVLIGPTHVKQTPSSSFEEQSSRIPEMHGDANANQGYDKGGNCDTLDSKPRLTAPVVLHSRSSSTPVEQMKPTSTHVRSHSGDANSKTGKSSGNSSNGVNDSDPFSFVASMIKGTKKEEVISTSKSKGSKNSNPPEEWESQLQSRTTVTRKNSNRGVIAAAQSLSRPSTAANVATGRSLRGRNSSSESACDRLADRMMVEEDGQHGIGGDAGKLRQQAQHPPAGNSGHTVKQCSQEVGMVLGKPDSSQGETASSQDTYEMDLSSSPVY